MFRKHLFIAASLLPLMALSGVAYAGPTITDKRYWPNEARSSGSYGQTDPYTARALESRTPRAQVAPAPIGGRPNCRYLGGPKSPLTC